MKNDGKNRINERDRANMKRIADEPRLIGNPWPGLCTGWRAVEKAPGLEFFL
jgi:hypothetical protein